MLCFRIPKLRDDPILTKILIPWFLTVEWFNHPADSRDHVMQRISFRTLTAQQSQNIGFNMSMFLPRMNAPCFSIRGFPIFVAIGITFLRYCSSPQKLERRWNMQGWMLLLYLISMCICACLTVIYFATRKILDIPSRMDLLMGLLWFNNHWFPYNFP